MSNIIPLDSIQLPAYLQNRSIATANDIFGAGLTLGGHYPMIGMKGTRFVTKVEGQETVLPTIEIAVVLVSAKPNLNKTYYAAAYDPSQTEAKAPDCSSEDGIKPKADSTLKQCESCAGCPQNQFGSGRGQNGQPSAGKACTDTKILAIYAQNGVFGFKITPASLKAFGHYVKETSRRGVDLSTAITVIGFDPNFSYPVLTFNFGGFLAPEQIAKIEALKGSPEVTDIVGGTPLVQARVQIAAPVEVAAPVSDPFAPAAEAPKAAEKVKPIRPPKEKPVEVVVDAAVGSDLAALAAELGL